MARVLGRTRISRLTEESTSLARQRELIEDWAGKNGHEIVAWAEDADVSGSVSPFDAPELGKFLTDEGARCWDVMAAWKLDRLARNAINTHKLFGWLQDNNKQLVCISENLDLSTWVGRMVAGVIAGVAEGELENLTERVSAGKRALRRTGRFQGGVAPFGYKSAPKEGGGRELVKDADQQKTLQWIFEQALLNRPLSHIADDLNNRGVDSIRSEFKGKKTQGWHPSTISTILNNKSYLGWTMYEGKPVLDEKGEPVLRCEPSISIEDFNRIQELWSSRSQRSLAAAKISPLHGVIVCWECGRNMHYHRQQKETSNSYWCRYHDKPIYVNARAAEEHLEEQVNSIIADLPILEKRVGAIQTSAEELEEARAVYDDIAGYLPSAVDERMRKTLFAQLDAASNRIKELEAAIETNDGTQWIDTGVTFGERWDQLDQEGRRLMLTSAGIKYRVRQLKRASRWHPPVQETELILPEQLRLLPGTSPVTMDDAIEAERRKWWAGLTEDERASLTSAGLAPDFVEED